MNDDFALFAAGCSTVVQVTVSVYSMSEGAIKREEKGERGREATYVPHTHPSCL